MTGSRSVLSSMMRSLGTILSCHLLSCSISGTVTWNFRSTLPILSATFLNLAETTAALMTSVATISPSSSFMAFMIIGPLSSTFPTASSGPLSIMSSECSGALSCGSDMSTVISLPLIIFTLCLIPHCTDMTAAAVSKNSLFMFCPFFLLPTLPAGSLAYRHSQLWQACLPAPHNTAFRSRRTR